MENDASSPTEHTCTHTHTHTQLPSDCPVGVDACEAFVRLTRPDILQHVMARQDESRRRAAEAAAAAAAARAPATAAAAAAAAGTAQGGGSEGSSVSSGGEGVSPPAGRAGANKAPTWVQEVSAPAHLCLSMRVWGSFVRARDQSVNSQMRGVCVGGSLWVQKDFQNQSFRPQACWRGQLGCVVCVCVLRRWGAAVCVCECE